MEPHTAPEALRIAILLMVVVAFLSPRTVFAQSFFSPNDPDIDPDRLERMEFGRRGSSWFSVAGYTQNRDGQTRDVGAIASLELPLDRLAFHQAARPLVKGALATAPSVPTGTFSATSLPVTRDVARSAVTAAWHAAGLGANDAKVDALASRARWSALFPETRLRMARQIDETARIDSNAAGPRTTDSAGANLWLEARLAWRLDKILYADDEPAFERMRFERHDARTRLAARVLTLLGQWQRAWVDARLSAPDSSESLETGLRLSDAEAALDVITGSWFGRWRASLDK
ncbi:hypothetical protein [Pendulispora albinea]|uniref:Uncharacterized protein n=1 Tax=Pendulispora albinea TaxID=2741071 RepID=A0ABZ2M4M3_9BACT